MKKKVKTWLIAAIALIATAAWIYFGVIDSVILVWARVNQCPSLSCVAKQVTLSLVNALVATMAMLVTWSCLFRSADIDLDKH